MKPLNRLDNLHLKAAEGWLELGKHLEANTELENISPTLRSHPDVLEIRWRTFAKAEKWEACADIASAIIELAPQQAEGWVHLSFSLHCLKRTQEAFDNLALVADRFPDFWLIPYNLACYCSKLGRFADAQTWFKRAMAVDEKSVQQCALDDPDLKPLWDNMSGTIWKRE